VVLTVLHLQSSAQGALILVQNNQNFLGVWDSDAQKIVTMGSTPVPNYFWFFVSKMNSNLVYGVNTQERNGTIDVQAFDLSTFSPTGASRTVRLATPLPIIESRNTLVHGDPYLLLLGNIPGNDGIGRFTLERVDLDKGSSTIVAKFSLNLTVYFLWSYVVDAAGEQILLNTFIEGQPQIAAMITVSFSGGSMPVLPLKPSTSFIDYHWYDPPSRMVFADDDSSNYQTISRVDGTRTQYLTYACPDGPPNTTGSFSGNTVDEINRVNYSYLTMRNATFESTCFLSVDMKTNPPTATWTPSVIGDFAYFYLRVLK